MMKGLGIGYVPLKPVHLQLMLTMWGERKMALGKFVFS